MDPWFPEDKVTTPAGELRGGADSLFFQHEERASFLT